MSYQMIRDFILNFWTRYGSSWVLKGFTLAMGAVATQQTDTVNKVVVAIGVLIGVVLDMIHSKATYNKAVTTPPPVVAQAPTLATSPPVVEEKK